MRSQTTLIISLFMIYYSLCCPTEPTDFLIFVKASYYLTSDQWENVKLAISKISSTVDLGRTKQNSQIGIVLYDNLNEPKYQIQLGSYGRSTDLSTSVMKLNLLPCGSWCSEQKQKSDVEQIQSFLSKQMFNRLTKIVIISSQYLDEFSMQMLASSNPQVQFQQFQLPQTAGIVTHDQPYYNYYQAYYDQYRRYAGRMGQLYPYMSVQVPSDQYPYGTQYYPGYGDQVHYNWVASTCYTVLGCHKCLETSSVQIEAKIDEPVKSVHSGDSSSASDSEVIKINTKLDKMQKGNIETSTNIKPLDDYEYEITADPPGMSINKTPLHDEVDEKSVSDDDLI